MQSHETPGLFTPSEETPQEFTLALVSSGLEVRGLRKCSCVVAEAGVENGEGKGPDPGLCSRQATNCARKGAGRMWALRDVDAAEEAAQVARESDYSDSEQFDGETIGRPS